MTRYRVVQYYPNGAWCAQRSRLGLIWTNICWTIDESDTEGLGRPVYFPTLAEAYAAIENHRRGGPPWRVAMT